MAWVYSDVRCQPYYLEHTDRYFCTDDGVFTCVSKYYASKDLHDINDKNDNSNNDNDINNNYGNNNNNKMDGLEITVMNLSVQMDAITANALLQAFVGKPILMYCISILMYCISISIS